MIRGFWLDGISAYSPIYFSNSLSLIYLSALSVDQELVVKFVTHKLPSRDFQDLPFRSSLIKNDWSAALDRPRFRILGPLNVGCKSRFRHP